MNQSTETPRHKEDQRSGPDDAVELQYIGANTFLPISHEGSLSAQ